LTEKKKKDKEKLCNCVSEVVTQRLALYMRSLLLLQEEGVLYVSSKELADRFMLNSDQIRKDLSYFGTFGKRGVGYSIPDTIKKLKEILGLNTVYNVAIAGAGNLGTALADYPRLNSESFRIAALFDNDEKKVGTKTKTGVPVYHVDDISDIVKEKKITMAMLAVPGDVAQKMADKFIKAGVKAIMNFAPRRIIVPPYIKTACVDFKSQLEVLSYYVSRIDFKDK